MQAKNERCFNTITDSAQEKMEKSRAQIFIKQDFMFPSDICHGDKKFPSPFAQIGDKKSHVSCTSQRRVAFGLLQKRMAGTYQRQC